MRPSEDRRSRSPSRPAAVLVGLVLAAAGGCLPASVRPTPLPIPSPSPSATPAPPATPPPTPARPTPTPGPTFVLHAVQPGENLNVLAARYGTTARSIAYWNRDAHPGLDPESPDYRPDRVQAGWILRVMPGTEYVPPPDDGETGEEVTPEPDDLEEEVETDAEAEEDAS